MRKHRQGNFQSVPFPRVYASGMRFLFAEVPSSSVKKILPKKRREVSRSKYFLLAILVCLLASCSQLYAQDGLHPGEPAKGFALGMSGTSSGSSDAPVTIIEFSDFQCSFCARVAPVLGELLKAYPKQIRLVFKHNPLPIHAHAFLAHEAALAAAAQGKFWEMHDVLFASQEKLGLDDLLGYAKQLNLDLAAFRQALETHRYRPVIEQSLDEARGFGVDATPTFFINGQKLVGAQSLSAFKTIIDQQLGRGDPRLAANAGVTEPGAAKQISISKAPLRGSPAAPVTIVEFSDFQCPFCSRAVPTIEQLLRDYPDRIRVVFKNFPLDFHPDALLAHQAALAAGEQGKFWEMHDHILANQRAIKRDDLIKVAKVLGLDVPRFTADLDSGRFQAVVQADREEGTRLGVTGTPTFFINGKELVGAAAFDEFKAIVDRELESVLPAKTSANNRISDSLASSLTRGASEAPVNIVWYADLASPLSQPAAQLVQQVMNAYPEKIRLTFKNLPLEFHPGAMLLHEAALAAAAQGKFWEMRDLILANQGTVTRADLIVYARRLGMNRKKFVAALDEHIDRPKINRDLAEALSQGVSGSPTFFVNGKRVDGVQNLAAFKGIVETQLQQVHAQATTQ